jgi:hypothetical protein
MNKKRLIFLCASLTVLAAASGVYADLSTFGLPGSGGSWSQRFQEDSIGSFDLVAVKMFTAGDTFETVTHSAFSVGGWSTIYENDGQYPTLATAAGSDTTLMQWNIKFAGNTSNTFTFYYVAFGGEDLLNAATATWNNGWTITNYAGGVGAAWTPTRAEVVPTPVAVVLGMLGLGVAGLKLRKYV